MYTLNRLAPSGDIATSFSVMEQLRFIYGGGSILLLGVCFPPYCNIITMIIMTLDVF